jgi:phosphopantothenoylcysteine decarboxylase / phosphopantothenate---cysteine ligase
MISISTSSPSFCLAGTIRPARLGSDIARALGAIKHDGQKLVGFALETDHELEHATDKLKRKNLDFIVLNSLRTPGAGFACDTNKVTLLFADGTQKDFPLKSKAEVADDIVDFI